jgi:hypothetical protein
MTAPLTFNNTAIRRLLEQVRTRWDLGLLPSFADDASGPHPGFWIVGDEGVYLMANGKAIEAERQPLVYADECNPQTLPFDQWWEYKCASFGGDDGAEFIDRQTVENICATGHDMVIEFMDDKMIVSEMLA